MTPEEEGTGDKAGGGEGGVVFWGYVRVMGLDEGSLKPKKKGRKKKARPATGFRTSFVYVFQFPSHRTDVALRRNQRGKKKGKGRERTICTPEAALLKDDILKAAKDTLAHLKRERTTRIGEKGKKRTVYLSSFSSKSPAQLSPRSV